MCLYVGVVSYNLLCYTGEPNPTRIHSGQQPPSQSIGSVVPPQVQGPAQTVAGKPVVPGGQVFPQSEPTGPPISGMPPPQGQPQTSKQGPPGAHGNAPASIQAMMSMQQKQNRIAPVGKPQGLDPVMLLNERENR